MAWVTLVRTADEEKETQDKHMESSTNRILLLTRSGLRDRMRGPSVTSRGKPKKNRLKKTAIKKIYIWYLKSGYLLLKKIWSASAGS